ncbi:PPOX class F420-dependent oxidoreductase [Actinomadura bangladeshensis]|uniref:PPOX class F420-dependent oxidoreductase n=1 Tax=Actinomadura bangladeshensis TaxID=453573 RepID=A0A6L9Q8V7_9ACTN|nr:PPOX class F420-dependent oxidoreductase [Actinomadura bangladeshensis]NEA21909.1 PPOX class F420-dependent oxidoreductase [Actinomadura bangladeshensis]
MEKMTESEWRAFVMEGTRTGKAGVVRKDGSPHVTPIWFVLDGGDLLFNTSRHSVKGRVLARDPRLSVCVDDQAPPYSYVQIQAEAALVEDLDEMRRWATAIGGRYMGAERAAEFGARNAVPTEYLVRARITRVVAERAIAG